MTDLPQDQSDVADADAHTDLKPKPSRRRRGLVAGVLLLVAAVIAAGVLWDTTVRDRLYPRRFGVVVPGVIYRSAQVEANHPDRLIDEHGIRHVVNLGVYKPGKPRHDAMLNAFESHDATHVEKGLRGDGTGDPMAYVEALTDMHAARETGQPIWVHCSAGVNRTGAAVALYRTLFQGWSVADARAEMLRYDFDPSDNTRLLPYLDEHVDAIAAELVSRGVLESAPQLEESFVPGGNG